MDDRRDIFDGKFSDIKEESKEELSFSKGAGNIGEGIGHIFRGFKHILFKKFPFNLLFLLLVLGAVIAGTYYLKPTPTGMVVYQNVTQECPKPEEKVCPEPVCPECKKCLDCPVCGDSIAYRYRCSDGRIVDTSSECEAAMPKVSSQYKSESGGVTLAINGIESDDSTIKKINYTIINQGTETIKPQIAIKVYERWNSEVRDAPPDKIITFNDDIAINSWVIRSDTVNVGYEELEKKIRLELKDAFVTPPEDITSVVMEFR